MPQHDTTLKTEERMTTEQALALAGALVEQMPRNLRKARVTYLLRNKGKLKQILAKGLAGPQIVLPESIEFQTKLWAEFFGIEVDLESITVPEEQEGRLTLLMPPVSLNKVWEACKELFPCYSYIGDDLAKVVSDLARPNVDPNRSYAISVKNVQEADEELANISADELAKRQILGQTLKERLIHEIVYWKLTGKHLDVQNVTLCSSSRSSNGHVPYVRWGDGRLYVCWYGASHADPYLRARAVVS